MNDSHPTESAPPAEMSREEWISALFAQLVIQQANMAMMLLGKIPHPQSGKITQDLEAARLFIDQLEMLEAKTKGNLSKEESTLLKQSLMSLQMAFVETLESSTAPKPDSASSTAPSGETTSPIAPDNNPSAEETKKKFSKKY